jgi:small subunit ribosomal protein S1
MTPGDIRKGTVKNITDFGAFIDLNGLDGLLHITDMSWGRIGHPSEILKVGQDLDVVVLDVNKEKERVSLGLKQKLANPWDNIEAKFPVGQKVKGKVVNLVPYGAFVELEPGVEGLVHVTELSWTKRIAKPSDVLKQGQEVEASCSASTATSRRSRLGIRQLETNPWDKRPREVSAGTKVKGKIRNLTSYGAFVELEEGIDGMIHVSDISWTRKINHPSEVLKKGDEVEAVVLEVDKSNQRIAVGMKQLSTDPWEQHRQSTRSAISSPARSPSSPASARSSASSTRSTVSCTSPRSARSAWTRSRTSSRSVRKSPRASSRSTVRAPDRSVHQGRELHRRAAQGRAEVLDALKPGEDLVALASAFDAADELRLTRDKPE